MRAHPLLAVTCLAAALVVDGCGGDGDPQASRTLAGVVLEVRAPSDLAVVRDGTVEVSGSVAPGRADVWVLGQSAQVSGGTFSATVPLEPGSNVIDVIATAPGRESAMTAVRVTREVLVEVPDVAGADEDEARGRLSDVGLKADVEKADGGLLDELLPGEATVCTQDPHAGARVRRGTAVHVVVSKGC
jgi:hypothetical protein